MEKWIEKEEGNPDSFLVKWFEGNLDPNFYYSERNEEMFIEELRNELTDRRYLVGCLGCDNLINLLFCKSEKGETECPFCGFRYGFDIKTVTEEELKEIFKENQQENKTS